MVALLFFVGGAPAGDAAGDPRFVGRTECIECHPAQATAFAGSDHDRAMDRATATTVRGDFDDAQFEAHGVVTTFSRRGDAFVVNTEGPDGQLADYEIAYTFGARPLQQYLIEFPGGRLQALSVAWDDRAREDGGQRWFHLYPQEHIEPSDPLHWTRPSQNWNSMCAECHSTNLRKNFDPGALSYDTSWSEIDVSCEACHGPGSGHVEWARSSLDDRPTSGDSYHARRAPRRWTFEPGQFNARLSAGEAPSPQIDGCSPCHAHRIAWFESSDGTAAFDDTHRLSLIEEPLYFVDGQMREEVYVTGSFRQSRMFHAGVQCTDCHDPHTTGLRIEGDALCAQCHLPSGYASDSHSHHRNEHDVGCVDCHMPSRTYMVIDERRDHAFSIPRPDLSLQLGTPNACAACHADASTADLARVFGEWYPGRAETAHIGEIIHAAASGDPASFAPLLQAARDRSRAPLVRAAAVKRLARFWTGPLASPLAVLAKDDEPLVRRAALEVLAGVPLPDSEPILRQGLSDAARAVRFAALESLTDAGARLGSAATHEVIAEYRESLRASADLPATQLRLAALESAVGDAEAAQAALRRALALDELFSPGYVNLADHYRRTGRDELGLELLERALERLPDAAALHHAYGLALVRAGRRAEAMQHLRTAANEAPEVARYVLVHAVALRSMHQADEAREVLRKGLDHQPFDRDLVATMVQYCREAGSPGEAEKYEARLRWPPPGTEARTPE